MSSKGGTPGVSLPTITTKHQHEIESSTFRRTSESWFCQGSKLPHWASIPVEKKKNAKKLMIMKDHWNGTECAEKLRIDFTKVCVSIFFCDLGCYSRLAYHQACGLQIGDLNRRSLGDESWPNPVLSGAVLPRTSKFWKHQINHITFVASWGPLGLSLFHWTLSHLQTSKLKFNNPRLCDGSRSCQPANSSHQQHTCND